MNLYLSSFNSNIARNFVISHSKLLIQNIHTIVRPLINQSQRVILSNIFPIIQNIQNIFKKQKSN